MLFELSCGYPAAKRLRIIYNNHRNNNNNNTTTTNIINNNKIIIIKNLKRKILSLETILSARARAHTHTHTHTHTHIHACTHARTRTHARTLTHYTHTQAPANTGILTVQSSNRPENVDWIKTQGTENMAGPQFWEKKGFQVRFEGVQRVFLSERKGKVIPC